MEYIKYDKNLHGTPIYPKGFEKLLQGLCVEEQLSHFRIGNGAYRRTPVNDRRRIKGFYSNHIEDEDNVQSIIVNNNTIAGIVVKNCHNDEAVCLPEQGYIIVDESEIDGSGYKEYQLFKYLICVPINFDDEIE